MPNTLVTPEVTHKVKRSAIEITVTRANGRVEHLGVVSFYEPNPWRRLWLHLKMRLGRRISIDEFYGIPAVVAVTPTDTKE
jgi:hypothetical protein